MDEFEQEALEKKLEQLKSEHRDLDAVIEQLLSTPPFDELQVQRLKKRKLRVKDEILMIENALVPDIMA